MAVPQLPAAGSLLPDAGDDTEVTGRLENWLAVTRQLPGAAAATTLTLDGNSGGRAVATGARHRVDTFGGAASGTMAQLGTDTLALGRRVRLSAASSLRPVTLLHAGGGAEQYLLAGGVAMALASDTSSIELELLADGWHEVDRWFGTDAAAFRGWFGLGSSATLDVASQAEAQAGAVDTRAMSPLKVRQALTSTGWVAALPVRPSNTVRGLDQLVYYDGTNLQRVAAQDVLGQAPNKAFDTGNIVISPGASSGAGFVHGLGSKPRLAQASLVCSANDNGYAAAAGDTVLPLSGVEVWFNGTNVGWFTGSSVGILHGTTGASTQITFASWRLRILCWT